MSVHDRAGQPTTADDLIDIDRLVADYYAITPALEDPAQRVSFGTSGHRGTSSAGGFNEAHILAITQAICEYRAAEGVTGPLFIGMDTHGLSRPALRTALEVLAGNGVEAMVQPADGFTPTPAVSHAILTYNRGRTDGLADGIVITPSHNPPQDGGFKYNPTTGGPAGTEVTSVIQNRANEMLHGGLQAVRRIPYDRAKAAPTTHEHDYIAPYVQDLRSVIDVDAIRGAGLRVGADPMGGASVGYWEPIAEAYDLQIHVVNPRVEPGFSFMTLDWDGKIRMDCSSRYAMAPLVGLKDRFDVAFGNDPDADRHGIVSPSVGLMNPNHYLAVAVDYLYQHRPAWPADAAVGKTLVSSSMIDRVAKALGRTLAEVPVGFKWFVDGLLDGSLGFGGEESAGASFLRKDGSVWTTDKDGILLNLLAAEIRAVTGKDPGERYRALEARFGSPVYERMDAKATREQKKVLSSLSAADVEADELAGEPVTAVLTEAPANGAAIGGLKVVTENGWFAARPSGTEEVYKIYAESFRGAEHLRAIQEEAKAIVDRAFARAGV